MEEFRQLKGKHGMLRGMVHHPLTDEVKGSCLIIHGYYSSNRIGHSRLFVQIARILARHGYRAWRFDSYGAGESDGDLEDTTYWDQYDGLETLIETIRKEQPDTDLMVLGHSMGASMGIRLSHSYDEIKKLFLISPVLGKLSCPENLYSSEQLQELNETGRLHRRGLILKKSFLEMMESVDIFEICEQIQDRSTTIIFGAQDRMVSAESYRRIKKALKAEHFICIPSADHAFMLGSSRRDFLNEFEDHILRA